MGPATRNRLSRRAGAAAAVLAGGALGLAAAPAAGQRFINADEVALSFEAGAASTLAVGGGDTLNQSADMHTDATLRTTISGGSAESLRYDAAMTLTTDGLRAIDTTQNDDNPTDLADPPAPLAVAVTLSGGFGELHLGHIDSAAQTALPPLPGGGSGGVEGRYQRFLPAGRAPDRLQQKPARRDAQIAFRSLPVAGIRLGASLAPAAGTPPASLAAETDDTALYSLGMTFNGRAGGWPIRLGGGLHGGGEAGSDEVGAGETRQELGASLETSSRAIDLGLYYGADLTPADGTRQSLGAGTAVALYDDFTLGTNLLRVSLEDTSRLAWAVGATLAPAPGLALDGEVVSRLADSDGGGATGDVTLGLVTARLFF